MSVNQHLVDYLAKLTPSESEKNSYSTHRIQIESKLKDYYGTDLVYETGSFRNGTGIRYHSDLDLLVSIPGAFQRASSISMLNDLKSVLQQRFPSSTIVIRTPAVVCTFSDNRTVEVTPGYYQNQTEAGYSYYKIPAGDGEWQKASPSSHNNYVTNINTKLGGKPKQVIRLLKAIKYNQNIPISSFYLELRVADYCSSQESIIYRLDIEFALRRLVNCELAKMQDPVQVSGYISPCNTEVQRQEALSKLRTALSRAERANELEKSGDEQGALDEWTKVFDRQI